MSAKEKMKGSRRASGLRQTEEEPGNEETSVVGAEGESEHGSTPEEDDQGEEEPEGTDKDSKKVKGLARG